jgi:hypothetical protein
MRPLEGTDPDGRGGLHGARRPPRRASLAASGPLGSGEMVLGGGKWSRAGETVLGGRKWSREGENDLGKGEIDSGGGNGLRREEMVSGVQQ